VRLHHGDLVRLGTMQLRFIRATPTRAAGGPAFIAGQQNAGQINNVARDQYLQAIVQQRESFLREVAASRTRTKRLIWFGFILFAVGCGAFAWMVIRFISRVKELDPAEQPSPSEIWGEEIGGIPLGLIGWAVAAIGVLLIIVGIVLHVIATSRQRSTVNQPAVPPEWLLTPPPWHSAR
jgi:hypothetical protein